MKSHTCKKYINKNRTKNNITKLITLTLTYTHEQSRTHLHTYIRASSACSHSHTLTRMHTHAHTHTTKTVWWSLPTTTGTLKPRAKTSWAPTSNVAIVSLPSTLNPSPEVTQTDLNSSRADLTRACPLSITQPINWSSSLSTNQLIEQPVNQSINQSTDRAAHQPIN